jgi:hypothetical protein
VDGESNDSKIDEELRVPSIVILEIWKVKKTLKTFDNNIELWKSILVIYLIKRFKYDACVAYNCAYMVRVVHEVKPISFEQLIININGKMPWMKRWQH